MPAIRLIPAHAGKTRGTSFRRRGGRAHPRSRGENVSQFAARPWKTGSSPLTRGKPVIAVEDLSWVGLIPAHAGKTHTALTGHKQARAHPRSRGENTGTKKPTTRVLGSSPLTRGKPGDRHGAGRRRRLIPAHAGKTFQAELEMIQERAHPRSRGENKAVTRPVTRPAGSSPLTRGKPRHRRAHHRPPRLIPAHAGKTQRVPA